MGAYILHETGAVMMMWNVNCVAHDEFKAVELEALKKEQPKAKVLVHPKSPANVITLAVAVGSTPGILKTASEIDSREFIVATNKGMMYRLRTLNTGKIFIEVSKLGDSVTCKSCAHCTWMVMNGLAGMAQVLQTLSPEVHVGPALGVRARLQIDRMLAFTAAQRTGQSVAAGLVPHIGAA